MAELLCSVVVPTYNRSRSLLRLLDSLLGQDLSPESFEVVVVDDGSTDDTWARLCEMCPPFDLRLFCQSNQGPAAARNSGIREARADLIVMLDDDVIATPSLLRQHVAAHGSDDNVAAAGVLRPAEDHRMKPWSEWELKVLEKQYTAMSSGAWAATPRQFYTANASVSRRALLDAGLFDPSFRRSEDMELAYRLRQRGLTFKFLPGAVVLHDPPRSFGAWKAMAYGLGFHELEIWRRFGSPDLTSQIRREFQWRPWSVQRLVCRLAGRRSLTSAFVWGSSVIARALHAMRLRRLSHVAYSAMFQVLYWHGACEALSGRPALLRALESPPMASVAESSGS